MTDPDVLDEATVVARARQGHLRAFEELIDRYQQPTYRFAYRMIGERQLAEDSVQETFIAVWRKLPTLSDASAFRGWLYQILTRRCLDAIRRQQRHRSHEEHPASQEHWDELQQVASADGRAADPAEQAVSRAQLDALGLVLHQLTDEQRACWLLREMQGLSYEETAQALNVSVSTVRGRLNRARGRVSERMASWR